MFALIERKFSGLYLTYIENNEKFTISYRLSYPDIYVDIIAAGRGMHRLAAFPGANLRNPSRRASAACQPFSSRQRIALRLAWRFMAPYRWRMLGAWWRCCSPRRSPTVPGPGHPPAGGPGVPHRLARIAQSLYIPAVLRRAGARPGRWAPSCASTWCPGSASASSPISASVFDHLIELHPGFYETSRSSRSSRA